MKNLFIFTNTFKKVEHKKYFENSVKFMIADLKLQNGGII